MEVDCQRCDEGLIEFLYGELDETAIAAFERHLDGCASCAAVAARLRQTREVLSRLEPAPVPAGLDDAILAAAATKAAEMARSWERIERAAAPAPGPGWLDRVIDSLRAATWRPAVGTVVVMVLVAGVGLVFLRGRPDRGIEPAPGRLDEVPIEELRAAQPAARPAPPVPTPPPIEPRDLEAGRPDDLQRQAEQVAAERPAVHEAQDDRLARSPARNLEPSPAANRAARLVSPEGGAGDGARVETGTLDIARGDRAGGAALPLVIDARPMQEPFATDEEARTREPAGPAFRPPQAQAQPIVPTPPLPGSAGPVDRSSYGGREQPTTPAAVSPTPGAAPAPPVPSAVSQNREESAYNRGMDAYRAGRYRDAADELNEFVRSPAAETALLPSGLHHLALSQESVGNLPSAARTYDQLLSRFTSYPRRPQAMLEAARVHARLGNYARAESLLRQLESMPAWSAQARSEIARMELRRAGTEGPLGPDPASDAAEDMAEEAPPAAAEQAPPGY
jgi:TolA-binding protein